MSIGTTTHKDGLLTGEDPGEVEEKTEAQKIDEYQPASMSASNSILAAAEDDETPAIDQKVAHQGIITETRDSKPDFEIDSEFEKEIKQREASEKAEREKQRKIAERKAKAKEEKRKEEIAKKLEKSQSLNPEEIEENFKEEHRKENANKLYPDARPIVSDVEEAIWEKRKENGAQIAGRAKIVDYVDEKLLGALRLSIACQIIGAILFLLPSIVEFNGLLASIKGFIYFATVILIAIGGILTFIGGNNTRHKTIPSDQTNLFFAATILPGLLIRALTIEVLSLILGAIPTAGSIISTVMGTAIGASAHYSYLNRFDIYVSTITSIINTAAFVLYSFLPQLLNSVCGFDKSPSSSVAAIYTAGIAVLVFFLADRMAMTLAAKTSK